VVRIEKSCEKKTWRQKSKDGRNGSIDGGEKRKGRENEKARKIDSSQPSEIACKQEWKMVRSRKGEVKKE
jgi:hypothetical protein